MRFLKNLLAWTTIILFCLGGVLFTCWPRKAITAPDNAVWLVKKDNYKWIEYQISKQDGKHVVELDLPESDKLYLAGRERNKVDIRKLPKDKTWLCENSDLYRCYLYERWIPLIPLSNKSLVFEEYTGSCFYVDLQNGKWLYFTFPENRMFCLKGGLLRVRVRDGIRGSGQVCSLTF